MSMSNFFNRPHYTSDTTDFINQLREKDPELEKNSATATTCCGTATSTRNCMRSSTQVGCHRKTMSITTGIRPTAETDTPGPAQSESAVALLYGEPLFELPQDLYIPPDALEVFLETFEGPLDLLLYLIRKQNFNILDIPMVALTRQYLSYVDEISARNLELAAEYLLMAALLMEIKSRVLLPRPPRVTRMKSRTPGPNWCVACWNTSRSREVLPALRNNRSKAGISLPRMPTWTRSAHCICRTWHRSTCRRPGRACCSARDWSRATPSRTRR